MPGRNRQSQLAEELSRGWAVSSFRVTFMTASSSVDVAVIVIIIIVNVVVVIVVTRVDSAATRLLIPFT